jgi:addiction module HigA family antidote
MKTKTYNPHPGEILLEEFLKPGGVTQYQLAKATGLQQSRLSSIINGKRGITAETALLIGTFFGTSPEMWLGLQNMHDLREAKKSIGPQVAKVVPYKKVA